MTIVCDFCGEIGHHCRDCNREKALSQKLKRKMGYEMEKYVSNNVSCPHCNNLSLKLLNNKSPSLDAVCSHCGRNYEIKSKCLSNSVIPKDIYVTHGNYELYKKRQDIGLDFIIIIYGVDRKQKISYIKKIIHIPNEEIIDRNEPNVSIVPNVNNNYCKMYINDYTEFSNYEVYHSLNISFKEDVETLLQTC